MGEFDGGDDLVAVGLEGQSVIEDGSENGQLEDIGDGEGGRSRGEVPGKELTPFPGTSSKLYRSYFQLKLALVLVVYYESRQRELKTRPIYECRCDKD